VEFVLNPRYERWRWQTFGITWLIYASFYLTRQSFGVAKVAFGDDPNVLLERSQYGLIDSTFLATYTLGQFLFGALGDRFGPRRILLFGLALSIAAAVASGFATVLPAFLFFAVLQGIGQSTGWSNVSKTMSSWFSLRERGRIIGLWCTHYTVGAAIALPFGGWMMEYFGSPRSPGASGPAIVPYWPAAFWGPAAALAVVLVLTWLLLRNRPEDVGLPPIEKYHGEPESLLSDEDKQHIVPEGSWKLIKEVLATPAIWMLAIAYLSIKLVRYSFYFWGPKYVEENLGQGAYESTLIAAAMPMGGLVGVIVSGFISDKVFQSRRAPVIVLSLLLTSAVTALGLISIDSPWIMAGFFFLIGVFLYGPDSMISATAAMDFGTKRGAGTAIGFINGVGTVGGVLAGWLPGKITTESDWTPLFTVFFIGLAISALVVTPLWRTRPPEA
jgi:OPA family sugar phosphate sensor protein UhpC-like MFS transporter